MLFETTDFRPVVGQRFQLRMASNPNWTVTVECEVLEVDKPHRLSYSWVVESQSHRTTVTWTLTATAGGGTRLRLERSGFDSRAKQEIGGGRLGWKRMLDQLKTSLAA
ncbi:MAG TPA: SRPBCC domain-containing protein [Bacillota bacterium]